VTTALSGSLVVYLAIFTPRGIDLFVAVATRLECHPGWLVAASVVLSLALFGAVGWGLARWVGRAYLRRAVSDQSLTLDALWLVFAVYYAMWLVLGGLRWSATAVAGFGAYKLVLALARRLRRVRPGESRGLTFLRVFALGLRSERLLETVAGSWRHVGSVQMITGPDVAKSTVQPHQFLDFLSRRLGDHFVRDAASLERAVAGCDREPGLHGRYQVNSFFCHADSWRPTLLRLVRPGDAVLMDLRSFSADNAGCIHELRHLVAHVPLDRCLLVVDATTDTSFLDQTLQEVWEDLPPRSPNRHRTPDETPRHGFAHDGDSVAEIVRHLCLGPATSVASTTNS
jgi:hypothetical protein